MLQVVVGIIFIILLLSLFATTVMEIISGLFGLRGRNLYFALKKMLSDSDDPTLLKEFQNTAMYKQLSSTWLGRYYPPSYLSSGNFRSILFNVLNNLDGERMQDKINTIPDESLRRVLGGLLEEANEDVDGFKLKVEGWFDDVMDRASGWFKRYIQFYLVILGFAIAVGFNADTIEIYRTLSNNPSARLEVYQSAANYVQERQSITGATVEESPTISRSLDKLDNLVAEDIGNIKDPLAIGWDHVDVENADLAFWLYKILGWLIMALAISLGAPFWFDLLRKIVNISSSGPAPVSTTTIIREVPTYNDPSTNRIEVRKSEG